MSRLIDADALMEASKYEFWQDVSAITPIGEYILKKFRQLIRNTPTVTPEPQWIPVSERLPEHGIEVVTVDKDGDYEINHIIDEEDGEWFWGEAIAWMPLPEPYREEGD